MLILNLVILKSKTSSTETEILRNRLDDFSLKQEFKDLEMRVLPSLEKVKTQLSEFKKEQQQFHEMIRRFDEIICEKASKASINEVILIYQI